MAEYKFDDIAINSTAKKKPVEEDKYHYLGLEHLDSGTFTVSRFGSDVAPIGDKLIMKKGDVLFGKRRAYQKKVAIAPFDGIFSAHGMVLRPKENVIDKDFFPLFIASDYFLDAAIKISVGSLSPTINWRDLKELKFNLPTIEEQKKLAETLWQIVATMESYKKLLVKTDEMVKAKFVEMFGNPFSEQTKKTHLKQYAKITGGFAFKSEQFIKDEVPIIRISNISDGKIDLDYSVCYPHSFYSNNSDYQINDGDILMAMSGATTGKIGMFISNKPALINQRVAKIREIENVSNHYFLFGLMKMEWFYNLIQETASGGAQPNISISQIENIKIPLSPIELQNKFADIVRKSEESKSIIQASLDSLTTVYKKIIAENLGDLN